MKNHTIIIGISGPSGSGKSLISTSLLRKLGSEQVAIIQEDAYYRNIEDMPPAVRDCLNFDHPDSIDHDLLAEHLIKLQNQESVPVPRYDYASYARLADVDFVGPHRIIVLEGILIFADARLRELMDIKIYIETPLDICLMRRLRRDIEERGRTVDSVLQQYEATVRPMFLQFIMPSKHFADLIVPRGGKNQIAVDLIFSKMRALLDQ